MRVVYAENEFAQAVQTARSEARSAFGDDSVFIEKYVSGPRHIEFQIMADNHGNVCHLFERECSIQRRHQKLVEEAPSAVLSPELRNRMGEAAVNVAKACNYSGAGTVEFLLGDDGNFYFLEMNTRLQVEHPVTECITGLDLVKEQIRVAAGLPLGFSQDELKMNGHAVELRVCAEDPRNNFLPSVGALTDYAIPKGPGVRVDDCMEPGMEIPIFYDNMISKLIAWGEDRETAIERLIRAIDEYRITGIETTLEFGKFVLNHPDFRAGNFDTHFIAKHYNPEEQTAVALSEVEQSAAAMAAAAFFQGTASAVEMAPASATDSLWLKNRKNYYS
jgi:acetyl-CoA carboxylase biotin carboxylase subunit